MEVFVFKGFLEASGSGATYADPVKTGPCYKGDAGNAAKNKSHINRCGQNSRRLHMYLMHGANRYPSRPAPPGGRIAVM